MLWAETRQTTRGEDIAYSLLGIFDVYIPLIYSEGRENAVRRLQEAINKKEKGMPFARLGLHYIMVSNAHRDQIRGLFGSIQSLYSL